jgi:hypothetical protein
MSNTSVVVASVDPFIISLNTAQNIILSYVNVAIFIFGNIGSILNVLVLAQRTYFQNSCSRYILASTITNLVIINIIVLFRLLAGTVNIDPTTTSSFFCKFRQYVAHVTTLLSRSYILLACIDRWAMSSESVRRRSFSQIKVARVVAPLVALVWCIVSIHIPLYYDIIQGKFIPHFEGVSVYHISNPIYEEWDKGSLHT